MAGLMQRLKAPIKKIQYEVHPRYRPYRQVRDRYRSGLKRVEREERRGRCTAEDVLDYKRRAFLAMPRFGGNLGLVQEGNFLLLKRLKQICEEEDLTFWMLGGTLLGAVRHKGYIPWDDDVDVGMLRQDAERLMQAVKKDPRLRLDAYCNDRPYNDRPIFHQVLKLTLADEESPFWVDILLYDWAGDEIVSPEELWQSISRVRQDTEQALIGEKPRRQREYWDERITDPADRERIDQIYEQGFRELPPVREKQYIYRSIDSVCGAWQRLFLAHRMLPVKQLEFEGELFPAPAEYLWYLQEHFGDYYTLPDDMGKTHTAFLNGRLPNPQNALTQLRAMTK